MKTRFILKAAAILVAMIFTMNGCGSSSNSDNDRNESSGGDDLEVVPAQFEKGVALFGHDSVSTTHFTHHLSPGFGVELAKTSYDGFWASMTPIWIDGKQYVMGHSENNVGGYDNPQYKWFIQRIYPSGDFGPITDSDHFSHYYKTLITLQRPGGRVFIYGQNDWPASGNPAFTREVLPGGKLTKTNSWYNPSMSNYFDTVTPLPNNYHTCFFKHKSDGDNNAWHIECITDEGKVWSLESGHWQDGYQVALSYRIKEWTHLFRHRKHYSGGPWSIKHITDHSHMYEDIIDSGTWDKHYLSMTTFYSPEKDKQYIIGHNT